MEGTDEATVFTDSSSNAHVGTVVGTVHTESDRSKFGSTSLYSPSTITNHLSFANSDTFDFGTGAFTIEFWFYPPTSGPSGGPHLVALGTGATFNPFVISLGASSAVALKLFLSSNGTSYNICSGLALGTATASTWNHVAVSRAAGGTEPFELFLNGTRTTTQAWTGAGLYDRDAPLYIGGETLIAGMGAGGGIDELRITKGVARYTGSTYTVPTAAFPDSGPIEPAEDVLVFTGETPVTVVPPVFVPAEDVLTLAGAAPTIDVFITFDLAGSYLLTGYAPGVQATRPMFPGEDVLAFTGELPGISRYLSVVQDSLFLTGQAPDLITLKIFEPAVGAMTLQGELPVAAVATYGGDVSFELWTVEADGVNSLTSSESEFAPWTTVAEGLFGAAGTGAPALEAWTAQGFQAPGGAPSLEPWVSTGTALSGRVGEGAPQFKALVAAGTSPGTGDGVGAPTFRALLSTGAGDFENDAVSSVAFSRLQAAGTAIGGNVGVGAALFKALTTSSAAYGTTPGVGVAAFETLVSSGTAAAALDATLNTWVMNTRTSGVTAYPGYPANSFARYNGTYLAAGPTGLFLMQGADSDGVDWALATGAMDDDKPELKRLVNILMGLRYDNPVRVTVTKDADVSYEYMFDNFKPGLLHQARVPIGKGMKSRYYKVGLVGTGRFELDSMQVDMPRISRRVG
jgi:hypothetical protein